METNALSKHILCSPDSCPMLDACPRGPVPGAPCFLKEEYANYIDRTIAQTFSQMDQSPETTLRINILLKPLFLVKFIGKDRIFG